MSRTNRRYTEDQKHQAVALAAALGNTALAERQAGVGNGCIHLWRTQGYGSGGPVTTVRRVAEGHQTDQSTVPFVAAAALTAAQKARVRRLFLPHDRWQLADRLSEAYGVPVDLTNLLAQRRTDGDRTAI